jgi:hypothetical protein
LFTVRNLLTDNEENQKIIDGLYVTGIPDNTELRDLGLKVEIVNGVLKLKKIDETAKPKKQ